MRHMHHMRHTRRFFPGQILEQDEHEQEEQQHGARSKKWRSGGKDEYDGCR